jgi:hypothetical protein
MAWMRSPLRVSTSRPLACGLPLLGTEDGETLLTLRHENLPSESLREGHDVAWNTYLPRLAVRAAGGDPGPDPHA